MIPVIVLTGFLGSGKTTLLARLLRSPDFSRTAVIINEFGEIGIDHDLVATAEESFVQLETGCICCLMRGDLEATLADLVSRRASGAAPAFERIVIETSGLADPAPVLNAVMTEAGRGAGLELSRVVTTVDAVTGAATLAREPQSLRQVAVADRLIITKTDLVDGGHAVSALVHLLRSANPRAPMKVVVRGDIDGASLFGALRHGTDMLEAVASDTAPPVQSQDSLSLQEGRSPAHDPGISCINIRRTEPIPALALTLLLETLADHIGADLLRLKGLVYVAERPLQPAVIHGVQHVFHEPQWLEAWSGGTRETRLVLIGRGLSQLWVEHLLEAIVSEVREVGGGRQAGA